jgi:hypothetical protein
MLLTTAREDRDTCGVDLGSTDTLGWYAANSAAEELPFIGEAKLMLVNSRPCCSGEVNA